VAVDRVSKAEKREARKAKATTKRPPAQTFSVPDIQPRNTAQSKYLKAIQQYPQVFSIGPAGVGKTYLTIAYAVKEIVEGRFKKLIVCRPMVSSDRSENIGFLPGDLNMKFTPWAIPILDSVELLIGKTRTQEWLRIGVIEFAPFQFMRGRTFGEDVFVILDEAQNCTFEQIKLFVTRLGDCKTVISGDPYQSDIKNSGLERVVDMVERHNITAAICRFSNRDVVRSKICEEWVNAFSREEDNNYPLDNHSQRVKLNGHSFHVEFGD
jgi:phosphate starvation-inducible protein PhoH and related proteins